MPDPYGRGVATTLRLRCWRCDRLLAEVISEPYLITCGRCKATNAKGNPPAQREASDSKATMP